MAARRNWKTAILVGLALALSACAQAPGSDATPSPSPTQTPSPTPTPDPIAQLVAQLTPAEKAGQLIMVDVQDQDTTGMADAIGGGIGSVVYLGTGWTSSATTGVSATLNAMPTPGGIGLFLAADQEGGQIQRIKGGGMSVIPSATQQGQLDAATLTASWKTWATELAGTGVNLDLAPVADTVPPNAVASNEPVGALQRYFSSDPTTNGLLAKAAIAGMEQAGIGSAVKHFPGLGRVQGNTDFTAEGVTDTETTADGDYLVPFQEAITASPTMVMISLATYTQLDPNQPAAFSTDIISGLLRGQLGWDGVVISDSFAAEAVASIPVGERAVRFVAAGGDIAIIPGIADATTAQSAIVAQMAADAAFAAQVDAAVTRVLKAKQGLGLLDA